MGEQPASRRGPWFLWVDSGELEQIQGGLSLLCFILNQMGSIRPFQTWLKFWTVYTVANDFEKIRFPDN